MQNMQERQEAPGKALLSAQQVQSMLHVDRSTVYRMAEDGRLPAIKVGRQWRFPASRIEAFLAGAEDRGDDVIDITAARGRSRPAPGRGRPCTPTVDVETASAVAQVAADLLGVMMVVTDMDGRPLIDVTNPCPWFAERLDDPELLATCAEEWQALADDPDLEPRFHTGELGFECARAFVRSGSSLVAMVLAGGIAPGAPADATGEETPSEPDGLVETPDGLYRLSTRQRRRVLAALPKVAASLSRVASRRSDGEDTTPQDATPHDTTPHDTTPPAGARSTTTVERKEP